MKAKNRYRHNEDNTTTIFLNDDGNVVINTADFERVLPYHWELAMADDGEPVVVALVQVYNETAYIAMHNLIMFPEAYVGVMPSGDLALAA